MHLADARTKIIADIGRMNSLYESPVFDEWVLVKLGSEKGVILAYHGPRADNYKRDFLMDVSPLKAELGQERMEIGSFVFVSTAHGTHFDACIRLGTSSYLFCNNTGKTMIEIRENPLWLKAQIPFVDLSAIFVSDPLE